MSHIKQSVVYMESHYLREQKKAEEESGTWAIMPHEYVAETSVKQYRIILY